VIIFHFDVKVTRQYDWHISQLVVGKNLNILNIFGEYPAKLENIKDFQLSLEIFGDRHTVTKSTCSPFTRHSASKMPPHEFEAGNLNDVIAMFCLSSFMGRLGFAIMVALSICL
jgi:hypothetical protein